jgi:hypothetical protein
MGVLQEFERRLEGAVEGFFARAFRPGSSPSSSPRRSSATADTQHVTADGVVVPNVYRIEVSTKDHERLETFGASLPRELGRGLVATAERGWLLRGPVKVRIAPTTGPVRPLPARRAGRAVESHSAASGAAPSAASAGTARSCRERRPSRPHPGDRPVPKHDTSCSRVRSGGEAGTTVPVTGDRVTMGRHSECDSPSTTPPCPASTRHWSAATMAGGSSTSAPPTAPRQRDPRCRAAVVPATASSSVWRSWSSWRPEVPIELLTLLKFGSCSCCTCSWPHRQAVVTDLYGPRRKAAPRRRPPVGLRTPRPRPLAQGPPRRSSSTRRPASPWSSAERRGVVLGRSADVDVVVDDVYVSDEHAEILADGGGWSVRDLGSTNGTFLNGAKVTRPTPLAAGDQLRLGKTACRGAAMRRVVAAGGHRRRQGAHVATRTPTSSATACSPSPTAWAVTSPARSRPRPPRSSPSARSTAGVLRRGTRSTRCAPPSSPPTTPSHRWPRTSRPTAAWARR